MRTLVAGVGNMHFGDDGFGVEVVHRLEDEHLRATVADYGIRAIHLAYELLAPYDLCIIADCLPRGGPPGTLYVIEPKLSADGLRPRSAYGGGMIDTHGMSLALVYGAVRELGGVMPRMFVVGCEPERIEPGVGLSRPVAAAIPDALALIRGLVTSGGPT